MGCNAWNHGSSCNCGWGGDTGGNAGPALPATKVRLIDGSRCWDFQVGSRLKSYTIPNAKCPVCGDTVFFFQSETGGRVFFDPPLGPPWPKHGCTDHPRSAADIQDRHANPRSLGRHRQPPRHSDLDEAAVVRFEHLVRDRYQKTGWRPLLSFVAIDKGEWQHARGIDPADGGRCALMTRKRFVAEAPVFIRITHPGRITCEIEQPIVDENDRLTLVKGRGWFGAEALEDARLAQRADRGDREAMRALAAGRSYRHLGRDNEIREVSQFLDLDAALYWFERAIQAGSEEAKFERAYLMDIIAQHDAKSKWLAFPLGSGRRRWAKAKMPDDLSAPLPGSIIKTICHEVAVIADLKMRSAKSDYYRRRVASAAENLRKLISNLPAPNLLAAIEQFLGDVCEPSNGKTTTATKG